MVPAMALIVRRVIAEGGRVQGRIILQHRQEALAIITSFLSLSNGGLKGLIRSFIRSTLSSPSRLTSLLPSQESQESPSHCT
jgi:hypothetical protein